MAESLGRDAILRFVAERRPSWERLETLLRKTRGFRIRRATPEELRELGSLYRQVVSDLAYAQTFLGDSGITATLNALAARAHNQVYRIEPVTWRGILRFYTHGFPQVFRRHLREVGLSAALLLGAGAASFLAVLSEPSLAPLVVPREIVESVYEGKMWTRGTLDTLPGSIASTHIMTNNIKVGLLAFALGITAGLGTAYLMLLNGAILGAVTALCLQYGMARPFFAFVTAHGVIEIASILVAGAAGFVLGSALLSPGRRTRRDALLERGREAVRLMLGIVPVLVIAGIVESYISPDETLTASFRIGGGLFLGAVLILYLFLGGRERQPAGEVSPGT